MIIQTTTSDINLGKDMCYGDVDDDMFDICFDKATKDENLSPWQ